MTKKFKQPPPSDLLSGETPTQYNARKRETAKNFERISKLGIDANLSFDAPPLVPPPGRVVDDDEFLAKVKTLTDAERAKKTAKAEIEAAADAERTAKIATADAARRERARPPSPFGERNPGVLRQVYDILTWYVDVKDHERVALALWCLHTHVYDRFTHTPRLALMSPEPSGGKSTVLDIVNQLSARSEISGNITGPSLFRTTDEGGTVLLDEGDNLNWADKSLRAVINDGHQPGRPIKRTINGELRTFQNFAPLGIAAIGKFPTPLMRRAIVVNMSPPLPAVARRLRKFTAADSFDFTWAAITDWAESVQLDLDPPLASILRVADNWRPLISIADSFGPKWGALARKSALAFQGLTNASVGISLLYDIRSIFNSDGADGEAWIDSTDGLGSEYIVGRLLDREESWVWSDYTGPGDDKAPRKLKTSDVATLLRGFGIGPAKPMWERKFDLKSNRVARKSYRGYRREWFEKVWTKWLPELEPAPKPLDDDPMFK